MGVKDVLFPLNRQELDEAEEMPCIKKFAQTDN